jgi:ankyrin repeat protein
MYSAFIGDNDTVKSLLDRNLVNVNYCDDEDGTTALMMAAKNNHLDVMKTLLIAGASKLMNHQTSDGWTALMFASQNGHLEVVKCLLNETDDPNLAKKGGFTALMLLCFTSYEYCKYIQLDDDHMQRLKLHCIPMIELLLDANASPVVTGSSGGELASLTVAAYANNLDAINVLMDEGVDFSNELITQALIAACYVGNPSIINALSHKITNLPHKELLLSCAEGDIAGVISAIYESNVNPDTPLVCGLTPLMVASSCGHIELIDALIQAGADINLPNDYGHTPLDIADYEYIRPPNQSVISLLVERGATYKNPVDDDNLLLFYSHPNNQPSNILVTTQESTRITQMKFPSILSLIKSFHNESITQIFERNLIKK